MSEFDNLSIDMVDMGCRALDSWQDAERRAIKR